MAMMRGDRAQAEGINNFCDTLKHNLRSCHTGYGKSAGWWAPMIAIQACAEQDPHLAQACADLTQTGETCHNAAFGNSCVPGIIDASHRVITGAGDEICAACVKHDGANGLCSLTDYVDYFGAARGVIEDSCDIGFFKETTVECPPEGLGYCKTAAQADCVQAGSCDKTSIYAKNITMASDTFVRVPGYGPRVRAHIIVGKGIPPSHVESLMSKLPKVWQEVQGQSLTNVVGKPIETVVGSDFADGIGKVPGFYEFYGLERPSANDSQKQGLTTLGVGLIVGGVAAVTGVAIYTGFKYGPDCLARWKRYWNSQPQQDHVAARRTSPSQVGSSDHAL